MVIVFPIELPQTKPPFVIDLIVGCFSIRVYFLMVVGVTSIGHIDPWVFTGGLSDGAVVLILGRVTLWSLEVVLGGVSGVCAFIDSIGIEIFGTPIKNCSADDTAIIFLLMIITFTRIPVIPFDGIPEILLPTYTFLFKRSSLIAAHQLMVVNLVDYWYFFGTWVGGVWFFVELVLQLLLLLTEFPQLFDVFVHRGETFTIVSGIIDYGVIDF